MKLMYAAANYRLGCSLPLVDSHQTRGLSLLSIRTPITSLRTTGSESEKNLILRISSLFSKMSFSSATVVDNIKATEKNNIVENFVLFGYPVTPDDEKSVLHWQISLSVPSAGNNNIVILNLIPGGADVRTGILMMSSQGHSAVASSPAVFNVARAADWTVQDVIDTIMNAGFHRYKYDDSGSGCRHWCTCVIKLFEEKGGVVEGASHLFEEYIAKENAKNPDRFPLPTRMGYFY